MNKLINRRMPTFAKWGLMFPTASGFFFLIGGVTGAMIGLMFASVVISNTEPTKSCTKYFAHHEEVVIGGKSYVPKEMGR